MSLYAIGDLHLTFSVDKPMDLFGRGWKNHEKKIEKYWRRRVRPEDTVVLTGDHSWGRNLQECAEDLKFIENLPGRKILLRGNHDMFWYEDYALVGTKGYCYEGWDAPDHFEKLMKRELARLRTSFEAARAAGFGRYLMFLHYPPTSIGEMESPFTRMAEEYGASKVIYSHCHGRDRFDDSFKGYVNGIEYKLVSSDYLKFRPELILEE